MRPIVGVIGGGQLARMMIPRAIELGFELRVLAETDGMSASLAATAVGDYTDAATVLDFARDVDVITFDHEHVPQDVLTQLVEAGVSVHPGPAPLAVAQDKIVMRQELTRLGLPVPAWASVSTPEELDAFVAANGGRVIVKTPRGGYDGKGVRIVTDAAEVADWFEGGGALLAEELVSFTRELAQLAARSPSGEVALWPLVESVQLDGVCAEVIAPAPSMTAALSATAAMIAQTVAEKLGVTGVLAVELFETADGQLLINELAMRPHNSGHWTMDGAVTSQFEQHLRAVLDLPLGATDARSPWTVMINVLGGPTSGSIAERYPIALANQPTAKFHEYGKAPRPGRKVGHVNVSGDDLDDVVYRARAAAAILKD
ncbi:phosphoribosylaminoimidazole carboxylase, ATPase subunit [marine actinobacterium PHSC20C1]|nr:phosphoribosylaminoimidazole carboxylase, ATPase subunit [marine actinobacterium PHSC20C1]